MDVTMRVPQLSNPILDTDNFFELDLSEEMEEVRELLYEIIKNNFPSGVIAEHLSKVYKESYKATSNGPELPDNWLEHIEVAEEFEVVVRGPFTMVYTRQRDVPPLKPTLATRYVLQISRSVNDSHSRSENRPRISLSDKELALQMKTSFATEPIVCHSVMQTRIVSCNLAAKIYVQLSDQTEEFEKLRSNMDDYYEVQSLGQSVTHLECDGVYAVYDDYDKYWYRAFYKPSNEYFFADVGRIVSAYGKRIKRLRADFALPRLYPIYAFPVHLDPSTKLDGAFKTIKEAYENERLIRLRFINVDGDGAYIVQCEPIYQRNKLKLAVEKAIMRPSHENSYLQELTLDEMPKGRTAIHVLAGFNPNDISVRQCSYDPIPDYVADALEKDSLAQISPPSPADLKIGCFYAAWLEGDEEKKWERVQLLGHSVANFWRVFAVDIGIFGIVAQKNTRLLELPMGLRKILMFKCKIEIPKLDDEDGQLDKRVEAILSKKLSEAKKIEIEPLEEWSHFKDVTTLKIPYVTARWYLDGCDHADIISSEILKD